MPDSAVKRNVDVPLGEVSAKGILFIPKKPKGLVIFAHGSGSSRFSPRNSFVADILNDRGFATLLVDLLSEQEEQDRGNVFDIGLLASHLIGVSKWTMKQPGLKNIPAGYFGASTGAAAALEAAAELSGKISAVVSRGGRPDLAVEYLPKVSAPTLLIVGGDDEAVIPLNKTALEKLKSEKQLVIIPGATHLFEEPGALEKVANYAADWFSRYLR